MAQATWHSPSRGYRLTHGFLRGFKPPSEETAFLIAFSAVILAVVILHARGAVKPRPEASPGVAIEAVSLVTPADVPLAGPITTMPVVPPPPVTAPMLEQSVVPAAPPASIRSVDLKTLPALSNLAAQTGATFDPQRTTYGELTGAGEVALVPLESGGSAGTVAVALIGGSRDGAQVLTLISPDKVSRARLRVELNDGQLVTTTAVLRPEDPLCCPSETHVSYYTWSGSRLLQQREVTTTNPTAKN